MGMVTVPPPPPAATLQLEALQRPPQPPASAPAGSPSVPITPPPARRPSSENPEPCWRRVRDHDKADYECDMIEMRKAMCAAPYSHVHFTAKSHVLRESCIHLSSTAEACFLRCRYPKDQARAIARGDGNARSVSDILKSEFYAFPSPPWPPKGPPPATSFAPPPPPLPAPPTQRQVEMLFDSESMASVEDLVALRDATCRAKPKLTSTWWDWLSPSPQHKRTRVCPHALHALIDSVTTPRRIRRYDERERFPHTLTPSASCGSQWWRWEWQNALERRYCSTSWLQPYSALFQETLRSRNMHTVLGNKKSIFVMCVVTPSPSPSPTVPRARALMPDAVAGIPLVYAGSYRGWW
jgi:hypothetical protein